MIQKALAIGSRIAFAALATCFLLLAGCSPHLAGTNDAALEYEVEAESGGGQSPRRHARGRTDDGRASRRLKSAPMSTSMRGESAS